MILMNLNLYIVPLILGWTISFFSVITGSYITSRAFTVPGKSFFNKVLLSMVVRMFVVLIIVFALIYFFRIDKISLAISFFFFYFLFLILEINFLSGSNNKN